jgi:hypothetical protein
MTDTILIVPISVEALAVNETSADQKQIGEFSGATTDFGDLPYTNGSQTPPIGENFVQRLNVNAATPLEPGIHLHWALPDTLTRQRVHYCYSTQTNVESVDDHLKAVVKFLDNVATPPTIDGNVNEVLNNIADSSLFTSQGDLLDYVRINAGQVCLVARGDASKLDAHIQQVSTDPDKYAFTLDPNGIASTFSATKGVRATLKNITGVQFDSAQDVKTNIYRLVGDVLMGDETQQYIIKRTQTRSEFPAAPNRWLVARLPVDTATGRVVESATLGDTTLEIKAWIVESDTLLNQDDVKTGEFKSTKVTIPVVDPPDGVPYRHVGVSYEVGAPRPTIAETGTIKSYTHHPLQAVSTGEPHFSAYYPDCQNVFGFCDKGADAANALPLSSGTPIDFTFVYAVIGWYYDASDDPLTAFAHTPETSADQRLTLSEIQNLYGWTFGDAAQKPNRSLYFGMIRNVGWNPTQHNNLQGDPLTGLDVSVGNNIIESLSAWVANTIKPADIPTSENLLSLFQLGLSSQLDSPRPDLIMSLEETLHAQEYSPQTGGTLWRLSGDFEAAEGATVTETQLGNKLNALNEVQFEFDVYGFELYSMQFQLFSDWYRTWLAEANAVPRVSKPGVGQILDIIKDTLSIIFPSAMKRDGSDLSKFSNLTFFGDQQSVASNMQLADMDQTFVDKLVNVLNKLGDLYTALRSFPNTKLELVPAPSFHEPTEPFIILAGDDLTPAWRYGGDSRYHDEGLLPCRLGAQYLQGVTVNGANITGSSYASIVQGLAPHDALSPTLVTNLLQEACVLQVADATSGHFEDLLAQYAAKYDTTSASVDQDNFSWQGELPCVLALQTWNGTPWLPLFLTWKVSYYPLIKTAYTDHAAFISTYYTLDPSKEGGAFASTDALDFGAVTAAGAEQIYGGTSILSPFAARPVINQLLANDQASDANKFKAMPVVAQSLTGFNNALLSTVEELQLKVQQGHPDSDHLSIRGLTPYVEKVVKRQNHKAPAISFNFDFNPIRAGYMRLDPDNMRVVDVFGRRRNISLYDCTVYVASPNLDAHAVKANSGQDKYLYLPPRLTQATRLLFNWCAASDDAIERTNAPVVTPICGWLVADYVNTSLFFFTSGGAPLGYLFVYKYNETKQIGWQSAPGNGETIGQDLRTVFNNAGVNHKFLSLATSFEYNNNPAPGTTTDNPRVAFFETFINSMRYTWDHIAPPAAGQNELAILMSRPLVVVESQLDLQLAGNPVINQTWQGMWDDYQTYDNDKHNGGVTVETLTTKRSTNGFEKVKFPVILGNIDKLGDGMVGYFLSPSVSDYDFSTFCSYADVKGATGLVQPTQTTLELVPAPDESQARRVLVLMDPRLPLHATTGALPMQQLTIPPDQYATTLRNLQVAFSMTPILTPKGTATLPIPRIAGYTWQWIQEQRSAGTPSWATPASIKAPTTELTFKFAQQELLEGWLRLKPNSNK